MERLFRKFTLIKDSFTGLGSYSWKEKSILLFDSPTAASDIAFMLSGQWDGCNGVVLPKCDEVAVNTAASLVEAEWCYVGTSLALLPRLTAKELLRRYSIGERHFINANLRQVILSESILSGVNLSYAKLSGSNLSYANISSADFTAADLSEANLNKANLSKASLVRTNMNKANLQQADLRGANLSNTCLNGANLDEADLRGANLSLADLRGASLSQINLHGANLNGAKLNLTDLPNQSV